MSSLADLASALFTVNQRLDRIETRLQQNEKDNNTIMSGVRFLSWCLPTITSICYLVFTVLVHYWK